MHNIEKLKTIFQTMSPDAQIKSSRLQALSMIGAGKEHGAFECLKPFRDGSKQNAILFRTLCTNLGKQALIDGQIQKSIDYLQEISNAGQVINSSIEILKNHDRANENGPKGRGVPVFVE